MREIEKARIMTALLSRGALGCASHVLRQSTPRARSIGSISGPGSGGLAKSWRTPAAGVVEERSGERGLAGTSPHKSRHLAGSWVAAAFLSGP